MTSEQRELEEIQLKASTMQVKTQIKKKNIIVRYWWENVFKVLTCEASKNYKKKTETER